MKKIFLALFLASYMAVPVFSQTRNILIDKLEYEIRNLENDIRNIRQREDSTAIQPLNQKLEDLKRELSVTESRYRAPAPDLVKSRLKRNMMAIKGKIQETNIAIKQTHIAYDAMADARQKQIDMRRAKINKILRLENIRQEQIRAQVEKKEKAALMKEKLKQDKLNAKKQKEEERQRKEQMKFQSTPYGGYPSKSKKY